MEKKFINLGVSFHNILKNYPERIAIKFGENEKYTYKELNFYSEKLLNLFTKLNIKKNNVIAIESKKNITTFSLLVACWKSGVIYSFFDTDDKSERVKKIFRILKPKKIFTFNSNKKFLNEYCFEKEKLNFKNMSNTDLKCSHHNLKHLNAYIMFTSGSTGFPKGVIISHKNLSYLIDWSSKKFSINKNSILTNLNPLHFDNSVFDIYASLFNGASLIPINKKEVFDVQNLLKKIRNLNCTIWFSVPSLLNFILKIGESKNFAKLKLKKMIFGGERFPINSIKQILKYLNKTEIYNVSGPTECTCICSAHKVSRKELKELKNIPIGNINSYFKFKLNYENKSNKKGELYLEGPAVSEGYYNNKKATSLKFYKVKNSSGYRTGDVLELYKKNNFRIIGRIDNQIKFLGHRIELEEIENVIIKKYNIEECLVIIKKMNTYPYEKLVCIVEKKNKKKIKLNNLSISLPYYMCPKELAYVKSFKYNKNGKVDRKYYKNQ